MPGPKLGAAGDRVRLCVDILVLDCDIATGGTVVTDPWEFGVMFKLRAEERGGVGSCSGGDGGGEAECGILKGVTSSNKNEEHS